MKDFLPRATDFTDLPVLPTPYERMPNSFKADTVWVKCPLCHGHGRWNLLLNEYGPGKHFQQACQCNGWGWVEAGSPDATCIHDMKEIAPDQPWRCWHTYKCQKCGHTVSHDSSD